MSEGLVIIPTYNEIENIQSIIEAVLALKEGFEVLVVDDNSPDGTAKKVETLQRTNPNKIHLLKRKGKEGLGTAYIEGFNWALDRHYEFIFEMDADFSHDPKDLPKLYKECQTAADVAIGSRYVKGVNVVNWPMHRILLSYGASKYVRLITRVNIYDPTAGFVCYRRQVLETIDLDKIKFIGYAFQIEMKYKAYKHGFKIIEVPVIFTDRTKGNSKMSGGIIYEAVFGVIALKIKSLFKSYKE
jgi:dolichol-phosphate mannosyltransferase